MALHTIKSLLSKLLGRELGNSHSSGIKMTLIAFKNRFSGISSDFILWEPFNIQVYGNAATVLIGNNVLFRSFCNILLYDSSELRIGKGVFFNNYCSINCLDFIEIGESTIFGEGVKIYDHNHAYTANQGTISVAKNEFKTKPVVIGSGCWIGSNVTILPGVTIGDNVIVGANNLIYKSIPANTIVKANTGFTVQGFE